MSRLGVVVLLAACLAAPQGCAVPGLSAKAAHSSPVATPSPAVGDTCLVGRWTLQQSASTSGYSFNNAVLPVAGLRGATMTIARDGTAVEDFTDSDPLLGTTADGGQLAITIRGGWTFTIKGTGHTWVEIGTVTQLPTSATFNGKPVSYRSSYVPGSGTYSCTSTSFTTISDNQVQTDSWSKGGLTV